MSSQPNGSSSTSNPASDIAKAAKQAFEASQLIPSSERINALNAIKKELDANKQEILDANCQDLEVLFIFLLSVQQCPLTEAKTTGSAERSGRRPYVRFSAQTPRPYKGR
jgi:hypothetical protein